MSDDKAFMRELQLEFLDELNFLLEASEEAYLKLDNPETRVEELSKIFRVAHSIKGAGAAVGFSDLASFAHVVEDCLSVLRDRPDLVDTTTISVLLKSGDAIRKRATALRQDPPPPWDIGELKNEVVATTELLKSKKDSAYSEGTPAFPAEAMEEGFVSEPPTPPVKPEHEAVAASIKTESQTIKVDSARVEKILNMVGELVVIKSQLKNEIGAYAKNSKLSTVVSLLDKTIRELQDRTLTMRMMTLRTLFLKAQRVARDLSVRLGKPIDFTMHGEDVEIDRNMVDLLSDPVLHLIRNSIDHGIEKPAIRKERKKREKGLVSISARQASGRVIITVTDDGGGIPRDIILKKAVEQGLIPSGIDPNSLADTKVFEFIFAAGFSTAEKVTDISGRGVGMNVVKENLEQLKGKIDIQSIIGEGTTFTVSLPLTTAITDGMMVRVDGQVYLLPIEGIRELVDLNGAGLVKVHDGKEALQFRGKFFPILRLNRHLRSRYQEWCGEPFKDNPQNKDMVVLFEYDNYQIALEVDAVLGQTQVVLKPLGSGLQKAEGIAGAAILGNGRVAFLLDIGALIRQESLVA